MMTCNNNNNNMLIIVMLLLITLMNTQIYAIGQEAIDAGLSETATSTHFNFFLDLSVNGKNSHQLFTNRNYLDTVYAFETVTGLSLQDEIMNKNDISTISSKYGKDAVENMWLELASLIYDPCVWKTIELENIQFFNPAHKTKPQDLSETVVGDECNTVGGSYYYEEDSKTNKNNNDEDVNKKNKKVKQRKLASPSFPGPAPDRLVANDKPNNDEGDALYADYSKFKFKRKQYSKSTSSDDNDFDLSDYMETDGSGDDYIMEDYKNYRPSRNEFVEKYGEYDPLKDNVNPNDLTIRILSKSPRVYIVPNFATDEETDYLINLATKWAGESKHDFTGFSYEQPVEDATAYRIAKRTEALLDLKNDMGQTLRMRHYEGGKEEYHPLHTDWFEIEKHDGTKSNLIVTAMLCLSTPKEGGATYFPKAKPKPFRVKPRKGMLVAWYSCTEEGTEDLFSEHEGELLLKGHKWTATNFLYQHHSQCSGRQLLGNIVDHLSK